MEKQPPPKQIYLQAYDSDSYDDNTWCSDKQNEDDIEYILQSEYDKLKSENERLQKYKEKLISDATQNEIVLWAYHDSLKEMKARVEELEAHNKDFHLACINALDLHRESDVPKLKDIPNIIEEIRERNQKLEIQLKSKDIIINNQQGRLNYYATKDLLGDKNE